MALPHLSLNSARRNVYERTIVNRRNHSDDNHEQWSSRAKYFHESNVTAGKKKSWESDLSYQTSMDAWKNRNEREVKSMNIKRRRLKLAEMLSEERTKFEAEMRGLSADNYSRIETMKDRVGGLRSAREDERKQLANEKLYEHWRVNSPDLRNIEMEAHKKHVTSAWSGQAEERKQKEEQERLEKMKIEEKLEEERKLALLVEHQREQSRMKEEKELKDILKRQMDELKEREKQSDKLKQQEDMLQKQQWQFEKMDEERKQAEAQRRKMEFGKILLRQHATALKRKSQQIQKELREDQELLERIIEQQAEEVGIKTARREKAQADAEWMRNVVQQQLKLEKAREAEMSQLYQDEAARVWQSREAEWSRERAARERLMNEVMAERKGQVEARMDVVQQQQRESLERREELLKDMERANSLAKQEAEQLQKEKVQTKIEIDAQVSARRDKKLADELRLQLDLEEDEEQQQGYQQFLQQEENELRAKGFQQKGFGRKQAWT